MDSRATAFIEAMAALAIIGVVSFLIFLVSRQAVRSGSGTDARSGYQPRWYELLLAAVFLVVIGVVALWQILPGADSAWGEDGRATTFFVVMMIIGGGALGVFLLSLFWRLAQNDGTVETTGTSAASSAGSSATAIAAESAAVPAAAPLAQHQTPSVLRLLGVLGFAIGFLILNWAHVAPDQRHVMMQTMIYPAGLIVALVMLFDKASRAWDVKAPGESSREWLYANAFLVLYLIAYLNLLNTPDPATYAAMFWDMVHVAAFLLVLWVLDRKTSRLRFLLVHAWLIALPVLLLIWRSQMGIETPEDTGWWDTIWPFFFLALVFFVIELIIQIGTDRKAGHGIGLAKDAVFLIVYAILLIGARPEAVA